MVSLSPSTKIAHEPTVSTMRVDDDAAPLELVAGEADDDDQERDGDEQAEPLERKPKTTMRRR